MKWDILNLWVICISFFVNCFFISYTFVFSFGLSVFPYWLVISTSLKPEAGVSVPLDKWEVAVYVENCPLHSGEGVLGTWGPGSRVGTQLLFSPGVSQAACNGDFLFIPSWQQTCITYFMELGKSSVVRDSKCLHSVSVHWPVIIA